MSQFPRLPCRHLLLLLYLSSERATAYECIRPLPLPSPPRSFRLHLASRYHHLHLSIHPRDSPPTDRASLGNAALHFSFASAPLHRGASYTLTFIPVSTMLRSAAREISVLRRSFLGRGIFWRNLYSGWIYIFDLGRLVLLFARLLPLLFSHDRSYSGAKYAGRLTFLHGHAKDA